MKNKLFDFFKCKKKLLIICFAFILMFLQFDKAIFDHQNYESYLISQNFSDTFVINKINNPNKKKNGYGLKYVFFKDYAHVIQNNKDVKKNFCGFACANNSFVNKYYKKGNFISFNNGKKLKIIDVIKKNENVYVNLEKGKIDLKNILPDFSIYETESNKMISREGVDDYVSLVGIQGHIFSFLYNNCHISLSMCYHINNLLLAVVLVVICVLVKKKTNLLFASIMYISFILSPWLTTFSRSLYWIAFAWFIPCIMAMLYFDQYKKRYLVLMYLSVLFKCLAGYEYISTIFIFALSIPFAEIIKNRVNWKTIIKHLCIISIVMICGFITAILIHASIRGNNLLDGINKIFVEDVLRRTYGNAQNFDPVYAESLNASPISVIAKYVYCFNTDIIFGIRSNLFPVLLIISAIYAAYRLIKDRYFYSFMYFIMLLAPLSWFILAKGHSYIHTHLNFVLWYFGFIAVMLYILVIMLKEIWNYVMSNKFD